MARKATGISPVTKSVAVKFNELDVELNFKKCVKNMHLKVAKTGKISMSLPFYSTQKSAFDFLRLHHDWLIQTHAKMIAALPKDDEINLLGKRYKLVINESLKSVQVWEFDAKSSWDLSSFETKFNSLSGAKKIPSVEVKFNDFIRGEDGKFTLISSKTDAKFNSAANYDKSYLFDKFSHDQNGADKFSSFSQANAVNHGHDTIKIQINLENELSKTKQQNLAQNLDTNKFDGLIYTPNLAKFDKFKKALATKIYIALIAKFSPHISKPVNRVRIRKMDTRWGSCNSRKGYINLSLNLLAKPLPLIEYVVLHELTHLIYQHHKASFYEFIARIMPDFRSRERELNDKSI